MAFKSARTTVGVALTSMLALSGCCGAPESGKAVVREAELIPVGQIWTDLRGASKHVTVPPDDEKFAVRLKAQMQDLIDSEVGQDVLASADVSQKISPWDPICMTTFDVATDPALPSLLNRTTLLAYDYRLAQNGPAFEENVKRVAAVIGDYHDAPTTTNRAVLDMTFEFFKQIYCG
jgi:hypothetical protein